MGEWAEEKPSQGKKIRRQLARDSREGGAPVPIPLPPLGQPCFSYTVRLLKFSLNQSQRSASAVLPIFRELNSAGLERALESALNPASDEGDFSPLLVGTEAEVCEKTEDTLGCCSLTQCRDLTSETLMRNLPYSQFPFSSFQLPVVNHGPKILSGKFQI